MKVTSLLPLVAFTAAFVIPDEALTNQIIIETTKETPKSPWDGLPSIDDILSSAGDLLEHAVEVGENALDKAMVAASDIGNQATASFHCHDSMTAFEVQEWLDSAVSTVEDLDISVDEADKPHHPPHHKKPHHGHHHKPSKTVYELINESKYTTKLAKLINKYDNLVEALNGTSTEANFTIFAPTDKAFEKLPKHHKDIPDDVIYQALLHHVSSDFYPAGRVLLSHTIPTMRKESGLGDSQRLRVGLGLKGLAVNFYSRIVAIDIFGTNGVIHGVDSLIFPPPPVYKIIELLPGEFSTLQLALEKTGLFEGFKYAPHVGSTTFAPSNGAFKKLGPKINAFLFSKYGHKYLKALLEYHVVVNQTLYSDAFYNKDAVESGVADVGAQGIPKGHSHVDLPTLLKDKSLSIDIARFGGYISFKINGYGSVAVQDGIAKDGVIHVVSSVLIPPKTPGGVAEEGEEMSVEDFKSRFEDIVEEL
ncbi:MAG: hypothetical protein M1818_002035 [Claussenomyces sp. TS43310]|nr:MAG: hypothetical protein M1818_002035 [Claussenomyces sp. TS43310]